MENINMDEIRKVVKDACNEEPIEKSTGSGQKNSEKSTDTPAIYSEKSISEISMDDIKVKLDTNKTYEEQAIDVAEMGAVVQAVADETVRGEMAKSKGEELIEKGKAKATRERSNRIKQETDEQKSKRDLYQALLETFGAYKHYPDWLMKIIVGMFTIPYLILLFCIGLPTGIIRYTVECVDNILVRYEEVDDKRKPKIRTIVWVVLALGGVCAIVFPLLKRFGII